VLNDGTSIGTVDLNLSDYAKPNTYNEQFVFDSRSDGVDAKSFIQVEIKTSEINEKGDPVPTKSSSIASAPNQKSVSPSKPAFNKQVEVLQNQVDKLVMDNSSKTHMNEMLRKEL